MAIKGVIFNIQKFSLHDGQGIRTIVFFKGCPLRCQWCSNPESQRPNPEVGFNPSLCLGSEVCGLCSRSCPSGAIKWLDGTLAFSRDICRHCFKCVDDCPTGARLKFGDYQEPGPILDQVESDGVFFNRSGGGLTISGGEALAQPEFALALLKEAKKRRLNTALETSGVCGFEILAQAASLLDGILYDLKHWSQAKHLRFTGQDNRLILDNLLRLSQMFPEKKIIARIPVIPGFNNTEEDLRKIIALIPNAPNIGVELLAYHRLGENKYAFLGRDYPYKGVKPDEAGFQKLKKTLLG